MNYEAFYHLTAKRLCDLAVSNGIPVEDLNMYMTPQRNLPYEDETNDLSRIFKRFCFHAQNDGGMLTNVIGFVNNYVQISHMVSDFDIESFLTEFENADAFYKRFVEFFPEARRKPTKTGKHGPSKKYLYCKSVYSCAVYLSRFNNYEEFVEEMLSYREFAPLYLSYNVSGFKVLAYDFLKELDARFDICKPDRHIYACIKEFFNLPDISDPGEMNFRVNKCMKELVEGINKTGIGITVYELDKMIYLICSLNFYNLEGRQNNTDQYEREYIEAVKASGVLD